MFSLFLRSFLIQTLLSYTIMQGLGFGVAMIPFARKMRLRNAELKAFLKRHLSFFNTHPYLVTYVIGAVGRLERDRIDEDKIVETKSLMMGHLGLYGDQVFWTRFKPLLMSATILILMYLHWPPITGNRSELILILLLCFLIYNVAHIWTRWRGLVIGYKTGAAALRMFTKSIIPKSRLYLSVGAAFTAGIFVVKAYGLNDNTSVFAGAFLTTMICGIIKVPLWINLLLVFSVSIGLSFLSGLKYF